ncbi:MAG: SPOR domain-containing protein [Prevotellaceae bacterium]|jgi:hypothetical protein|nr:SPOR domain-containing protein [Prevotellaceae bacterium]
MKPFFIFLLLLALFATPVLAQVAATGRTSTPKNTTAATPASKVVPPSQYGKITVQQSPLMEMLVKKHIAYNQGHPTIEGYRIRIYRDNSSNARTRSQEVMDEFATKYPETPSYRTYDNPYFKVAAGDFRTKDDALRMFNKVRRDFPKAFIIAEDINLPPLYKNEPDTAKFIQPLP